MDFLRGLIEQIRTIWSEATVPARIGFIGVTALLLCAVVMVGIWSSQPEFVPLANGLAPAEAAELVSKLDAENIENQLNYSGSAVLVPRSSWNRARLIAGDLAGPVSGAETEFQDSLLSDPTLNHFRILRNREEDLARTLTRMTSVTSAKVHIGRPEPSPFLQDEQPATASVILGLRSGAFFTREQVSSVVSLVANSVEGLTADHVSVMDTSGKLLTSNSDGHQSEIDNQYEFRRKVESDLSAKAESMLSEILGPGHAIVRVTADLDFTQTTRQQTTYDPSSKVKTKEEIESTSSKGGGTASAAGGAAGTASNIGLLAADEGAGDGTSKTEKITAEYLNAETTDTIREASGTIKRLTVAATVDLASTGEAGEDGATSATAVTKEQVEAIIKQAVGFDLSRSDEIEVLVAALAGSPYAVESVPVTGTDWPRWLELARNASLGLAAMVSLILGSFVVRRMKPVEVTPDIQHQPATGNPQRLGEFLVEAREHPELIAQILATWLGEEPRQEEEVEAEDTTEQSIRAAA